CHHDPPRLPLELPGLSISSPPSGMSRQPRCAQFPDSCLSQARNAHRESPLPPAMLASPSFHDILNMLAPLVPESLTSVSPGCKYLIVCYPEDKWRIVRSPGGPAFSPSSSYQTNLVPFSDTWVPSPADL